MPPYKSKDCEYSELIAELMITLDDLDKYTVKMWISNKDIPYTFRTDDELIFMQEGVRASKHIMDDKYNLVYIWYDTIESIVVMNYES